MGRDSKGRFMKGNENWQKGKREYSNCLRCNKKIRIFKSRQSKFCGHSCAMLYQYEKNLRKVTIPGWNKGTKGIMKPNSGSFTSEKLLGENNYNWKGGITPLNNLLRKRSMWKIWREAVFLRDNFTCQNPNCEFCSNKIGVLLHPHHIKPLSQFPKLAFRVDNGITYCAEFHIKSGLHKNMQQIGREI